MPIKNIADASKGAESYVWYVPNWNGDDVPFIEFKPANADNPTYTGARLAHEKGSDHQRIARGGAQGLTVSKLDQLRESEYPIFAKTIVVGWSGFFEDAPDNAPPDFKPVPHEFKAGDYVRIEALLRALGKVNFDSLREAARSPEKQQAASALGKR
jgi:hypothetical protein